MPMQQKCVSPRGGGGGEEELNTKSHGKVFFLFPSTDAQRANTLC